MLGIGMQSPGVMIKPNVPMWMCKQDVKVLKCDGVGDYAWTPSFSDLWSLDAITISCWINFTAAPGAGEAIMHKGGIGGVSNHIAFLTESSSGQTVVPTLWNVESDGSSDKASVNTFSPGGVSGEPNLNKWHHLLVRWDKDTDGGHANSITSGLGGSNDLTDIDIVGGGATYTERDDAGNSAHWHSSGTVDPENARLIFGGFVGNAGFGYMQFTGVTIQVADFAIYPRYLSDDEVYSLKAGIDPNDVAGGLPKHLWTFNNTGSDTGKNSGAKTFTLVNAVFGAPSDTDMANIERLANL